MMNQPNTEQMFRDILIAADIPGFLVANEIVDFARELLRDELAGKVHWKDVRIPSDARRHSQGMGIALPAMNAADGLSIFLLDEPDDQPAGSPESIVYEVFDGRTVHLGNFIAGEFSFIENRWSKDADQKSLAHIAATLATVAFVLSIINQPRIVRSESLLSRQQRRAAERGGAKTVNAWRKVSWDLSKETVAKISRDPDFHKVPLHWRRGHFRRAEAHYKGAVQRPDAIREDDRQLWWQWIEGQWVGHPAFGIKRSVHAPQLSTGHLAERRSA